MSAEERRQSQADRIITYTLKQDVRLFTDQRGTPYIKAQMSEVYETRRLRTRAIRAWLAGLMWREEKKAPGSEALASALNVLEAQANEGSVMPLYNRVASDGLGGIYIDMADTEWRAIHVTMDGWEISDTPPVLFRRYSHQKPLPKPVRGGSVLPLLDFMNLKDEGERLLYLVAVVSSFIPDIPHPILVCYGPQGSGKTGCLKATRAVIDPSILGVLTLPRRQRELVQNLDHHYCAFYDNVGPIPTWISNVLCRAVTGTGVSNRQLYTDEEDVIFEYHRCCGLTDINIAAERGDLLDRSILLGFEYIPDEKRRTEKELDALLGRRTPEILGGILDVLVKALNLYPKVEIDKLFRMADFTRWGYAIAKAMGRDPEEFVEAYRKNIEMQSLEAIRASPLADVLVKFVELKTRGSWSGTASQLWTELEEMATGLKISTRQKAWPKNPKLLSRRLNELVPSLPAVGIEITKGYRGKSRIININVVGIDGIRGSTDDTDDTNNIRESYSPNQRCITDKADDKNGSHSGIAHSLQGHLDKLVGTLSDIQRYESQGPVTRLTLLERLERDRTLDWDSPLFDKVLDIAIRDGRLYEPRPGFISVMEGA